MKKTTNLLPSWNTFRTFLLITTLFTTGLFYSCKKTDTASSTPAPTSGYKSSGKIKFSPVAGLFNSGIGLREFFQTVMVEDITKETTVDFIVSANKNPEKWTTVKTLPAKYSRAFKQGVPREIYFSATDAYQDSLDKKYVYEEQPSRYVAVDLTNSGVVPAGIMIPGQTYYVHAYISGSYTNSSQPITLQGYPDKSKLPKQISKENPVWAADEKPGQTYDANDPATYFSKSATKGTTAQIASQNAYLWGIDFWRKSDGSLQEIKLRLDEVNYIPIRYIRPFKSSYTVQELEAIGVCARSSTTNAPVFQSSPDGVITFGAIWTWETNSSTLGYVPTTVKNNANLRETTTTMWFYNRLGGLSNKDIADGLFLVNKYNYDGKFSDAKKSKTAGEPTRPDTPFGIDKPVKYEYELACLDEATFSPLMKNSSQIKIYVIEK